MGGGDLVLYFSAHPLILSLLSGAVVAHIIFFFADPNYVFCSSHIFVPGVCSMNNSNHIIIANPHCFVFTKHIIVPDC